MKNQYVGDVNDFVKYGLLRSLTVDDAHSSFVAWLLTPDDLSRDGRKLAYLSAPDEWRHHDPWLFDGLQRLVVGGGRSVDVVAAANLLPRASFFSELVTVDRAGRRRQFDALLQRAAGHELVFFDPDNGLEVSSCPVGRRGSDKYLLWEELTDTYQAGHSVLVYQHFRREARDLFVAQTAERIAEATDACEVFAFRTSHVVFFLAPQHAAAEYYGERARVIATQWTNVIIPHLAAVT